VLAVGFAKMRSSTRSIVWMRPCLAGLIVVLGLCTTASASSSAGSFYDGPAGGDIILPPRKGVLVGAASGPPSAITNPSLTTLESLVGRSLDIEHRFMQQRCSLEPGVVRGAARRGHIPLISWVPNPSVGGQVLRGDADACIRRFGRQVARQPYKLFLRPYWEFNGTWFAHSKNVDGSLLSADEHKAMWRRTVKVLHAAGAFRRASIVWCPSEGHYGNGDAFDERRAYPGDEYVDWVCADGFNLNSSTAWCGAYGTPHAGWCEFGEIFHDSTTPGGNVEMDFRSRKPFMIAETGSLESAPGKKGEWLRNIRDYSKASMPGLSALVYFDVAFNDADWRVATSSSSLQGLRDLIRDPYFDTRRRGLPSRVR